MQKLRSRTLQLAIKVGRYIKQCLFVFYVGVAEDGLHFVFHCPLRSD